MKIAFFGSSLVAAYWNGAATHDRGLVRALAGRGHRITFCEPDAFDRQAHRDMDDDPPRARVVVHPVEGEGALDRCLEQAAAAELVVEASGVGIFDASLERKALALRGSSTRVVLWDVDAPATLERVVANPEDPLRRLIPRYDALLTYGDGSPVVRAYRELGALRCVPGPATGCSFWSGTCTPPRIG